MSKRETAVASNERLLEVLHAVAETLKLVVSQQTEVVVHDLLKPEASITKIVNGHVSEREVGDPLMASPANEEITQGTLLRSTQPNSIQILGPYTSQTASGRSLQSAATVYYDERRRPVAAIGFNTNANEIDRAYRELRSLMLPAGTDRQDKGSSTSRRPVEELLTEIIEQAIAINGGDPKRMTKPEKMAAVLFMHERGLFLMRGSVETVASHLMTTKFTIYKYLDELGLR